MVIPVTCAGCHTPTTRSLANEHHVVPQAAGGRDGPRAYVCADCHGAIHRLAEGIRSGRVADILDAVRIRYPDVETHKRLLHYAGIVALEMDQRGPADPESPVRVNIELPRKVVEYLRIFGNSLRDPATGRKLGVAGYVRRLILGHVDERIRGGRER